VEEVVAVGVADSNATKQSAVAVTIIELQPSANADVLVAPLVVVADKV